MTVPAIPQERPGWGRSDLDAQLVAAGRREVDDVDARVVELVVVVLVVVVVDVVDARVVELVVVVLVVVVVDGLTTSGQP